MTRTPRPMTLDAFRELTRGARVVVDEVLGGKAHVTIDHGRASTLCWVPAEWVPAQPQRPAPNPPAPRPGGR